jgi:hypothetical protein
VAPGVPVAFFRLRQVDGELLTLDGLEALEVEGLLGGALSGVGVVGEAAGEGEVVEELGLVPVDGGQVFPRVLEVLLHRVQLRLQQLRRRPRIRAARFLQSLRSMYISTDQSRNQ